MIGFFDSGYGGLSVLEKFQKEKPEYSYLYYSDNNNSPYGNKTKNQIYKLAKNAIEFLFVSGAELVIVSCNTISASALRELQDKYFIKKYPNKKVLGIIIPNTENIIETLPKQAILGIIGTKHTIKTGKYNNEILKNRKDINIFSKACPLFATYIENRRLDDNVFLTNIKEELSFFKKKNITHLLLACTHYSYIKSDIKKILDKNIIIIDSSEIIFTKTIKYLNKHNYLKIKKDRKTIFYINGSVNDFKLFYYNYFKNLPKRKLVFLKNSIFSDN